MLFIREKPFYRTLLRLAVPITLTNVMSVLLNITDTVMLGRVSDSSEVMISAANLANQPVFIVMLFVFGTMSGANVLISQYWGKRDTKTINSVVGIELITTLAFGVVSTVVLYAFATPILGLFNDDPAVIAHGADYLRIIASMTVPTVLLNILCGVLRGVEQVRVPMFANTIAIVLNIFLNYTLIFGKFGAPALGIKGAAYATNISRAFALAMVLVYVIFFEKNLRLSVKKMLRIRRPLVADFARYSAPVVANETIWAFGITCHSAILGNIGTDEYAAYTIINVVERIVQLASMGFANAAAIIIGTRIGEFHVKNNENADPSRPVTELDGEQKRHILSCGYTLVSISVLASVVMGAVVFLLRSPILGFYQVSELTMKTASELIVVMLITSVAKAYNSTNIVGLLRGAGSPMIGMILDTCVMWAIAIPLGYAAARFGLPFWSVYACLMSDEVIKILFGMIYMPTKRWIKDIIRV